MVLVLKQLTQIGVVPDLLQRFGQHLVGQPVDGIIRSEVGQIGVAAGGGRCGRPAAVAYEGAAADRRRDQPAPPGLGVSAGDRADGDPQRVGEKPVCGQSLARGQATSGYVRLQRIGNRPIARTGTGGKIRTPICHRDNLPIDP